MQRQLKVPAVQISETRGNSLAAFDRQITPIGRAVQIHLPGIRFTWHRPLAVEIRQGETVHRLPIHGTTSRATSAIVLTGLVIVLVSLLIRRIRLRRRRRTS